MASAVHSRSSGRCLLALITLLLAATAGPAEAAGFPVAPGLYVGVGTHSLHVNCSGEGTPTVIFESGLGGTSLDWVKVQEGVSRFTRACSYDRAGYGWSERGRGRRSSDALVRELRTLSVYASLRTPYVLVGHSIGGVLVRRFAERYPETVAGLVLVDSSHEEQFRRMEAAGLPVLAAPPRNTTFVISNYWHVPEGLPLHLRELARRLAIRPSAVRTLYQEMTELRAIVERRDSAARLPDVPVTVIARAPSGTGQPASNRARLMDELWREMQSDLARAAPRGVLVPASGSGHYVHLDRPDVVVDAIRLIVEEARATAPGTPPGQRRSRPGARPAPRDVAAGSRGRVDIRSAPR